MSTRGQPAMIVVAGPAGSGKSTVFPLVSTEIRVRAGTECRVFIEDHIASHVSFAVETTLRTEIAIEQAAIAKAERFRTIMLFVTTDNAQINIARITARGLTGGHSSPSDDIRAIFQASMANLPRAIPIFDRVECFDNSRSGQRPVRVLAFEGGSVVQRFPPLPSWANALDTVAQT